MTNVYFIRHAESDYSIRESRIRPLTEKGVSDCSLITEFLSNKDIDIVLSSSYKRTMDTLRGFANQYKFEIQAIEDFREIKGDSGYLVRTVDFSTYMRDIWANFDYRLGDGESLAECQKRNIVALGKTLTQYKEKNIVIGTHGIALSAIINHYDNTFRFEEFMAMAFIFPWVVKMSFEENKCIGMEEIDLFV